MIGQVAKTAVKNSGERSGLWERAALVWLALLCALVVGAAYWGSSRGFDLTDEGSYYLDSECPADSGYLLTSFHYFNRLAVPAFKHDIAAVRRAVFGPYLLAALVFHLGAVRLATAYGIRVDRLQSASLYLLLAVSSLLGLSWTPPAFSYNTINAMCVLGVGGFVLLAVARSAGAPAPGVGAALGCVALLIGFDWFIKPPTALALALLCGFLVLFVIRPDARGLVRWGGMAAAGLLAGAGVTILAIGSFPDWTDRLLAFREARDFTTGNSQLAADAVASFLRLLEMAVIDHWWMLAGGTFVLAAVAWARRCGREPGRACGIASGAAVGTLIIADTLVGGYFRSGYGSYGGAFRAVMPYYLALTFLLAIWVLVGRWLHSGPSEPRGGWSRLQGMALSLFLFGLPLAGAFGSSNPLEFNALFQMPPLFFLMWLFLSEMSDQWRSEAIRSVGTMFLATLATCQFLHGYVLSPYNLPTDLFGQNQRTRIGAHGTLLQLDPQSRKFIERVRKVLEQNGFRPGGDLLAFYNLPGLVYVAGGRSPGHSWYFGDRFTATGLTRDRRSLLRADAGRLRRAFILHTPVEGTPFAAVFAEKGIAFPGDYVLCGTSEVPHSGIEIEIWKPRPQSGE